MATPTHHRVLAAARLMAEQGVDVNILCTVHEANEERGLEVYRYFRDEVGARYLQFIPIVERATPESAARRRCRLGHGGSRGPAAVHARGFAGDRALGDRPTAGAAS